MKTLYQAANAVEAHMIVDLLAQQGLTARVTGEYLQGGVGELPAMGLVRVVTEEDDYAAAKKIVDEWDAAQPVQSTQDSGNAKSGKHSRARFLVAGLVAGAVVTYAFFHSPISHDGIDYDGDGRLDEKWFYAPGGQLLKTEIDRNGDKKVDFIFNVHPNGNVKGAKSDDDFDGRFETTTRYQLGNPHIAEIDSDGDTIPDLRTRYRHGVADTIEYIHPANGRPEKIEYLLLGKVTHAEFDLDKDGKLDQRKKYDALGEVIAVETIRGR